MVGANKSCLSSFHVVLNEWQACKNRTLKKEKSKGQNFNAKAKASVPFFRKFNREEDGVKRSLSLMGNLKIGKIIQMSPNPFEVTHCHVLLNGRMERELSWKETCFTGQFSLDKTIYKMLLPCQQCLCKNAFERVSNSKQVL